MRRTVCVTVVILLLAVCAGGHAAAAGPARESVELTIYNNDLGLVKEVRTLDLKKGLNEVRLEDVAALLDATSVTLVPLERKAGAYVQEQNFEYDLASDAKLLFRYINKPITVLTSEGKVHEGALIAGVTQKVHYSYEYDPLIQRNVRRKALKYSYGNLVLAKDGGEGPITIIQSRDNIREIQLPALPAGLVTKPTLMWEVVAQKAGMQKCLLKYLTKGMEWRADYSLLLNDDDTRANVNAWVTLDNRSGMSFEKARVKLMAGDVATEDQDARRHGYRTRGYVYGRQPGAGPSQDTRQVFEYHLYGIEHATTVKNNQTKQVKLLNAEQVPVTKFYVYDGVRFQRYNPWQWYNYRERREFGTETNKKVMVFVEFVNTSKHGLGSALPRGKVRLFKQDKDRSVQFIGEDMVDHRPANELVRVRVGEAFDLVGERKQTEFKKITPCIYDESFEIAVRNQKKEGEVEVRVVEHLYRWYSWAVREKSHDFTKTDAQTIEFRVRIPAGGEEKITYRVRYNWGGPAD